MKPTEENSAHRSAVIACLEAESAIVRTRGYWNCLAAARKLSALLLAEGRRPWIARLRKTQSLDGRVFHAPLSPLAPGVLATWTTHYVCCCDEVAYDPVAGKAIRLEDYSLEVFGKEIPTEIFVTAAELPAYLASERRP